MKIKNLIKNIFKRKKLFADYISEKNNQFYMTELYFSCLHFISGNPVWFCRIWDKAWIGKKKKFGQSFGRNKFEAYRLALNDLRNSQ